MERRRVEGRARDKGEAMANVSPDLLWGMVKDSSCFLKKKKISGRSGMGKTGIQFTSEPNNIKGINSFKFSGLANTKAVGITAAPDNKGIVLTKKITKADRARKPSKMLVKTTLSKGFRRVAKAIKAETEGSYYRADLTSAALAKWSLIYASQKKK